MPGGSGYSCSTPRRPAARSRAKHRYGFVALSGLRTSMRVEPLLVGLYIGTRTSALRLLEPQQTYGGASPPPISRL